jgi:hypothetical protein
MEAPLHRMHWASSYEPDFAVALDRSEPQQPGAVGRKHERRGLCRGEAVRSGKLLRIPEATVGLGPEKISCEIGFRVYHSRIRSTCMVRTAEAASNATAITVADTSASVSGSAGLTP